MFGIKIIFLFFNDSFELIISEHHSRKLLVLRRINQKPIIRSLNYLAPLIILPPSHRSSSRCSAYFLAISSSSTLRPDLKDQWSDIPCSQFLLSVLTFVQSPIESLPLEIQLKILCYLSSPHDLTNVLQASRSLHTLYKAHSEYIATAVIINETFDRGIQLLGHSTFPLAYLECWASPSFSPVHADVMRELLKPPSQGKPILSLPQCATLRGLGALRGWTLELGDDGEASVRPCTWQMDSERVEKYGYDDTNFQLLILVGGGTPHDFEALFAKWSEDDYSKRGEDRTLSYDSHGNIIRSNAGEDQIVWSQKRVYFESGTQHLLALICVLIVCCLIGVSLGVLIGIVCVTLSFEDSRSIAWWKALLY